MSYTALYRQYRPAAFGAVIGQAHITTILKNQVRTGHVAHAYLFSGTRGTGKTTTARIFARAINCLSPVDGEPCENCEACKVSAAENPDIVELDAASNSSVDDIRALVEKARYTPMQLSTKVYIIDEAHALSTSNQAFNALLKTLEEPPAHLVFILATTEPQKLPATIRSRCQRLDFRRLRMADMAGLLRGILEENGVRMEEEGLLAIARAADGGMRDALSLLDQCLAFCGSDISAEDVYRVLGSMDGAFLFDVAQALIEGEARRSLCLLADVAAQGRDMGVFAHDLLLHMRALLIAKLCGPSEELLDCAADEARRYHEQGTACGEERLLRAVELLSAVQAELKYLPSPRAKLESTLVRIAQPEQARSLSDLLARIEALEDKLARGMAAAPPREAPEAPLPPAEADWAPWEEEAPAEADWVPWEDAPPAGQPPAKAARPKGNGAAAISAPPSAKAAPAVEAPSAEALFRELLDKLRQSDILLFGMAKNALPSMEGDTLVLRFQARIYEDAVKKSIRNLEALVPCPVRVGAAEAAADDTEARAKALFGAALRITD